MSTPPSWNFKVLCKSCLEVDCVVITIEGDVETTTCQCGNAAVRTLVRKESNE